MNKSLISVVLVVGIFLAGFLTSKYYYKDRNNTETTDEHTKTKIIRITDPDGTKKEIITIDEHDKSKTKTVVTPKTNVSLLIVKDYSKHDNSGPEYGVSMTREVLGPVTIGVFGLTNKTIGISIGYNF